MRGLAAELPTGVWDEFCRLGIAQNADPGRILLRQGETADHVVVLLSGRVKITLVDRDGRAIVLAVRGPGEVLGEIAVLDGATRSASVTAIDPCRVRVVPVPVFLQKLRLLNVEDVLVRHTLRRLRESEQLRLELATLPARQRVHRALVRLAVPAVAGAGPVDIGLTQAEFGEAVGLKRSSVASMLAEFRDAGLISTRRGRIVVVDMPRLCALPVE
ncbi:Crp/Fnr family transcriptional regulator [Thermomonospora amylolytica]|uniref:Crp/Fnr family transcriptional regulator n=1 Tax=Thermomonospora amylolytica TaxID=1411117 RepID=UPI001F314BED|nr:Crp/Fnr family transcriptional regulator [Thermomonospora amylolytica]